MTAFPIFRCGMVYYDPLDLGWKPYVKSWMQRVGHKFKQETQVLLRSIFTATWWTEFCLSVFLHQRLVLAVLQDHLKFFWISSESHLRKYLENQDFNSFFYLTFLCVLGPFYDPILNSDYNGCLEFAIRSILIGYWNLFSYKTNLTNF